MKYQSVDSFEKHIREAYPDHFSSSYLIVCPQDFERKLIIDKVASALRRADSECLHSTFSSETPLNEILQQLCTKSLFATKAIITIDNVEKWTKQDIEKLTQYLCNPSGFAYLILGASSSKNLEELYKKSKKELVLLDIAEEKPWDREKRIAQWLVSKIQEDKKNLSSSAASYLLEHHGTDVATLSQELEKIVCFVGDKTNIQLEDILPIASGSTLLANGWQIAEKVVWKREWQPLPSSDISFLISLLGQVRYHLQLGMQISTLQDKNIGYAEIQSLLPSVKPANVEKFYGFALTYTKQYFYEGLLALFEMEKACKKGSLDPMIIWESFLTKLTRNEVKT
ncbi:MAG: hypothetical protein HKM07_01505 [Chlamydiae bacterium]|nr:hypothetical protein [Chlamydiota bacterium]